MTYTILLESILPLALLVLLGFVLNAIKIIKDSSVRLLNKFVYFVALPSLIISAFSNFELTTNNAEAIMQNVILLAVFSTILFFILNITKVPKRQKVTIFIASIIGNTVYFGVPIYDSVLDVDSSLSIAIASAILVSGIAYSMIAIEYWATRSRNTREYITDLLKNPLIISIGVGLAINLLGQNDFLSIPDSIDKSVGMLAGTASPVALVALGAFLHGRFSIKHLAASAISSVIKLVILPAFIWVSMLLINTPDTISTVSIIASGMPLAITGFVLADKYKLDEAEIANTLLISTILSFMTLPIIINIL